MASQRAREAGFLRYPNLAITLPLTPTMAKLTQPPTNPARCIHIDLGSQQLFLKQPRSVLRYPISAAANGAGERISSECTPRGWHCICAAIGTNAPVNTVFVGRRPSGETYTPALGLQCPERDWILTRILWLAGLEAGYNLHGTVDTQSRYIYIHGTPDTVQLGRPGSHGCIRMRNPDIIELFDHLSLDTPVYIQGSKKEQAAHGQ